MPTDFKVTTGTGGVEKVMPTQTTEGNKEKSEEDSGTRSGSQSITASQC